IPSAPTVTSVVDDPAERLVAANAAFRTVRFDAERDRVIDSLQMVLSQYAEILKRDSSNFDAAYNYQFVARIRDWIANRPRASTSVAQPQSAPNQTLHGAAGGEFRVPQENEFKIISPHESDERLEEEQAGSKVPRGRKG